MTPSGTSKAITPRRVGEILWRRRLVCAIVAVTILAVGSALVLTRPKVYQSTSSIALLPATKNPSILPNYPNLIISLLPTYVQLVSSPVLLNQVAAKLPFHISESQLASDVQGESLSNAAIINIVARSHSPVQAREIDSVATRVFLAQLRGNGVVIPRIYGRPTASQPAPPSTALLLVVVLVLALILGGTAGLIWDRWASAPAWSGRERPAPSSARADHPSDAVPPKRAEAMVSGNVRPIEPSVPGAAEKPHTPM